MSNPTFSFISNAYGFAFGVLSLVGSAIGMCRWHLPSRKIQTLEELLAQTQDLFHSAVEAGLLPDLEFRTNTESRLERLREDTLQVRAKVCVATTLYSDYRALFRGLSFVIAKKCSNLKELRANVITTSEKYRLCQNAVPSITGALEREHTNSDTLSSCGGTAEHSSIPTEPVAESIHKPTCHSRQRAHSCPPIFGITQRI
ncbi:hypothetical protein K503DRAFT_870815 [Rhizopogon vinicolor AM-OR11-026]|uniref:Uncharacterized protein n=1 Tax=Rhizopogon vinicolor AM-OR11-026 TaxID=1314800 RepID=A0A1B7MEE8_9AGAM|nr:hypothetical protein K503DRAFT_870815 [Rhizopogon vinicolor AM-OR11-026]